MENRNIDRPLGDFLYQAARKSKLTDEEIADRIGCSTRLLGYYYSGERKPGQRRLLTFLKVTNLLNTSIPF